MDDLIGEFITETSESLAVLDHELVKLEQNPGDRTILSNIFRLVHTIKGTCGFLGLPRLEAVAHAGEEVLGKIRDGEIEVSQEAVTIVLDAIDCIKALIAHIASHGQEPDGDDAGLIHRLNKFSYTNIAYSGSLIEATSSRPDELVPFAREEAIVEPVTDRAAEQDGGAEDSVLRHGAHESLIQVIDIDTPLAPTPPKAALTEKNREQAIRHGLDTEARQAVTDPSKHSIRVHLDLLENLLQNVGELVLARNQLLQLARTTEDQRIKGPLLHLSKITAELQENAMKTRMQPIGNAWSKFPRLVRDISYEMNKKIELKTVGEATELDRQLLEMIRDPLTHMVRNACDHGIETPRERTGAGKPETATLMLSAYHEGGHIIIEVTDDGRGIDVVQVRAKALERGLASEADLARMSADQITRFIFSPGFSTADKITSVSGRGVGLDVVRTNIEKIGGIITVTSTRGEGTSFYIKIPLTLAIMPAVLIGCNDQKFAVPQVNVVELVRIGGSSPYRIEMINQTAVLRIRGRLLPLMCLRDILGLPEPADIKRRDRYVVVVHAGTTDVGIIVDTIFDTEEIVVKPVSALLSEIDVYAGNTILGDGSVIMILDPNGIARAFGDHGTSRQEEERPVANAAREKRSSFLVFHAGPGGPKAVPLELVSRLEVIDASQIELSGGEQVIQYRGELMRLKLLPGSTMPDAGAFEVVVFTYDRRTIGMAVDRITDISEAPADLKLAATAEHLLGSTVIAERTTDIVDVGYLLRDMAADAAIVNHRAPRPGIKLLIVEDSPFFRQLIARFLTDAGYDVTAATGAADGLALALNSQFVFDAIITDIEMPVHDGFWLTEAIRTDQRMWRTPIIAYASTVNQAFRLRAQELGMRAIILKTDREGLLVSLNQQVMSSEEAV